MQPLRLRTFFSANSAEFLCVLYGKKELGRPRRDSRPPEPLNAPEVCPAASNQILCGSASPAAAAFRMVNYCFQLFLPPPERQIVGIDEQFERTAALAVDLGRVRSDPHFVRALFLSAPDSAQGSRHDRGARADSQRGF